MLTADQIDELLALIDTGTGTALVPWLDTPRYYVNEYSKPKRPGLAPSTRVVYIDRAHANAHLDAAAADYAHRAGTVEH